MIDHRFHVGAVGNMVALPDVLTDTDATQVRIGGYHQGLGGGGVADVQRVQGRWAWAWDGLLDRQVAHVEALHNGLVPGPLRLVDPRRINRLPIQFASGGSQRRSPTGTVVSAGTVAHRRLSVAPADVRTLPARTVLRGAFEWTLPAGSSAGLGVTRAATVGPTAPGSSTTWRVPLLLDADGNAEQIVMTAWACAALSEPGPEEPTPTPVAASLARVDRDRAGAETSWSATKPVLLRSDRWSRVSWTFTPKRTAVESTPTFLVAPAPSSDGDGFETGGSSGSGGGTGGGTGGDPTGSVSIASTATATVYVTALQWAVAGALDLPPEITVHCDPLKDDPTGGFRIGGGAPEVTVPEVGAHGYGLPWAHKLALTLLEA